MSLEEFERKNSVDQAYDIWQQGVFLLRRKQAQEHWFLYDMGLFFAEVCYHGETNRLGAIRSFKNTAGLKPYYDLVDFSDLHW